MRPWPTLLVVILLAGCLAPRGEAREFHVSGGFTREASQADVAEAARLVEAEDGSLRVLESFPMRFQADGLDAEGCGRVRDALRAKPYVADVGECVPRTVSADPERPVSS